MIGGISLGTGATSATSVEAGALSSEPIEEVGSEVSISVSEMGAGLSTIEVKVLSSTLVVETFANGSSPVGNKPAVWVTVTVIVIVTVRVRPSFSSS